MVASNEYHEHITLLAVYYCRHTSQNMYVNILMHFHQSLLMNHVMRKPALCIRKNAADQHLCFRYEDRTIPLLPRSKISSLQSSSVAVKLGLCRIWSETLMASFLMTWLRLLSKQKVNIYLVITGQFFSFHQPLSSPFFLVRIITFFTVG